ncbi:ABC transporter ATP-binding protein [Microbacterium sp. gxy059]|uniref:ABC transporter ATP-binding protein n=1 Tax=Microbacterium sp. gxy059 TaxID=2957199 RepID=UPI003D98B3B6
MEVENLRVGFETESGETVEIVEDVSFTLHEGQTLCLVGESGSGKSVTALAVLGLLPPPLEVLSGSIRFRGRELTELSEAAMRRLRGKDIAMVFQDPMTSLNPVKRVGDQIGRAIRAHDRNAGSSEVRQKVREILDEVGIRDADERMRSYPHQWSGGMRQRAVIGMAMANDPAVLLADEPTTALDVTVQAQVIDVLARRRRETGAAMLMITHDLGLVAQIADDVAVMYAGRVAEKGTVWDVFDRPAHPYTRGLLGSLLTAATLGQRAYAIPGSPPAPAQRPAGCPFAPRCESELKGPACHSGRPVPVDLGGVHQAACVPLAEKHAEAEAGGAAA